MADRSGGVVMQAAAYASKGAVLTADLFSQVLKMKLHEHQKRREFAGQGGPALERVL